MTEKQKEDIIAEQALELDQLRKFLRFEPDPGPGVYAWCCWCQESHPIDQPHVGEGENKARMDFRLRVNAEIRGLEAEILRLSQGDFTDKTLQLLVEQINKKTEFITRLKGLSSSKEEKIRKLQIENEKLKRVLRSLVVVKNTEYMAGWTQCILCSGRGELGEEPIHRSDCLAAPEKPTTCEV